RDERRREQFVHDHGQRRAAHAVNGVGQCAYIVPRDLRPTVRPVELVELGNGLERGWKHGNSRRSNGTAIAIERASVHISRWFRGRQRSGNGIPGFSARHAPLRRLLVEGELELAGAQQQRQQTRLRLRAAECGRYVHLLLRAAWW